MLHETSESAPVVLRLLAHDLRWQLLSALATSDRRVSELVEIVGERQNLLSYHLGLLRRGGLVTERRSSADARDVYYSVALDRLDGWLAESAGHLHPALGRRLAEATSPRRRPAPARVLFLCTGNSARSLIAEAVLRQATGGAVDVASAGTKPAGVHPLTLRVLAELGIPAGGLKSKAVDEVAGRKFDHVITLCDLVREDCPALDGKTSWAHWSLADPALVDGSGPAALAAFRIVVREIQSRVTYLIAVLDDTNRWEAIA